MKIGIDLDGVITPIRFINPSLKLPRWLYIFFIPTIFLTVPNKNKKEKLKKIATNYEIIIISARPKEWQNFTEMWLRFHQIPFKKLYWVGPGGETKERKRELIKREEIKIFIEDNREIREYLKGYSINVVSGLNGLI